MDFKNHSRDEFLSLPHAIVMCAQQAKIHSYMHIEKKCTRYTRRTTLKGEHFVSIAQKQASYA